MAVQTLHDSERRFVAVPVQAGADLDEILMGRERGRGMLWAQQLARRGGNPKRKRGKPHDPMAEPLVWAGSMTEGFPREEKP